MSSQSVWKDWFVHLQFRQYALLLSAQNATDNTDFKLHTWTSKKTSNTPCLLTYL